MIDRLAKNLVFTQNECNIENIYPLLRTEMGQFVTQETANGNIRYAADTGCHDDLVMSLAISTWVLTEEYGEASPASAVIEDVMWQQTGRINLENMRKLRQKAIDEMERQEAEQWETFILNNELLRGPYEY